ncbi:hypothetical protein [Sporosarcina sp. FSL K6-3457]|uniref:hypothetical protein n=1 Tax=Sporosarcina sp. FSL K6-3457 TaxID=2978204 RepID=UPI0030F4D823
MTGPITGSMNGNGDDMQKTTRKIHPILLGTLVILVIIVITSNLGSMGGEKGKKEESREFVELEQALMKVEGLGEVILYPHYEYAESANPLADYFSSSTATAKKGNALQGLLVVAEGAEDLKIRNQLSGILSAVLQLSEHRIVIAEMEKRGNTNENE